MDNIKLSGRELLRNRNILNYHLDTLILISKDIEKSEQFLRDIYIKNKKSYLEILGEFSAELKITIEKTKGLEYSIKKAIEEFKISEDRLNKLVRIKHGKLLYKIQSGSSMSKAEFKYKDNLIDKVKINKVSNEKLDLVKPITRIEYKKIKNIRNIQSLYEIPKVDSNELRLKIGFVRWVLLSNSLSSILNLLGGWPLLILDFLFESILFEKWMPSFDGSDSDVIDSDNNYNEENDNNLSDEVVDETTDNVMESDDTLDKEDSDEYTSETYTEESENLENEELNDSSIEEEKNEELNEEQPLDTEELEEDILEDDFIDDENGYSEGGVEEYGDEYTASDEYDYEELNDATDTDENIQPYDEAEDNTPIDKKKVLNSGLLGMAALGGGLGANKKRKKKLKDKERKEIEALFEDLID